VHSALLLSYGPGMPWGQVGLLLCCRCRVFAPVYRSASLPLTLRVGQLVFHLVCV
jgi:hypothetical protein